jgi:MazG family protein
MQLSDAGDAFARLAGVMRRLRSEGGCPWDRQQDHQSLRPYLVEEAYEVLEALDDLGAKGDSVADELCGELGDLLFQVVFHSRLAEERGVFDLEKVCSAIEQKLLRRHPHVFGDTKVKDTNEVVKNWEQIKLAERNDKKKAEDGPVSALTGVPRALPALLRAQRISEKAAKHGFDWPNADGSKQKIAEELQEIEEATSKEERAKEVGDLLFAVVNYARHLGVNAEDALRGSTERFQSRFSFIEHALFEQGKSLADSNLEEMDNLWNQAKEALRPK